MTAFRPWVLFLLAIVMFSTLTCECGRADETATAETTPAVAQLTIGSKAPSLDIEHWLSLGKGKFEKVTELQAGKIYVVEFWATWCQPCVASMPHLAAMQEKFADKDVQFISVSAEDLETVEAFLKREVAKVADAAEKSKDAEGTTKEDATDSQVKPDDKQTYAQLTSAYCLTADPDGSVQEAYMKASGQNAIPTSFLVGRDGIIEWIGHPMELEAPITALLDGTWDRESARAEFAAQAGINSIMQLVQSGKFENARLAIEAARQANAGNKMVEEQLNQLEFFVNVFPAFQLMQSGKTKEGLAKLDELQTKANGSQKAMILSAKFPVLLSESLYEQAGQELIDYAQAAEPVGELVNQMAWQVYEVASAKKDVPASLITNASAAIEKAIAGAPTNGPMMDTAARLAQLRGDAKGALEWQRKAVENVQGVPDETLEQMKAFLAELEKVQ